jgi:O-antigen/teichoic acid export membrane protein
MRDSAGGSLAIAGSVVLAGSKVWAQICGLILLALAARYLTLTEFGVFALASAISMGLNQWVGVGAYEYVIRETENDTAPSTAFWLNTLVGVGLALLGLLIARPVSELYKAPDLYLLLVIMAPLTIPAGWRSVGESLLVRRNRLGAAGGASIAVETLAMVAAIWAFLSGYGLWALAVHKAAQFLLAPVFFLTAAQWAPSLRWRNAEARAILRLSGPLTTERVLGFTSSYGVDLVLGLLLNPAAVGVYRIGVRIITAVQFVLFETLKSRAWTRLSKAAQRSTANLAETAEMLIGQAWVLCLPVFVGLALTADLVVAVALGEGWEESAVIVRILCASSIAAIVSILMEPLAAIHRKVSVLVALRIVMIAALIPAVIFTAAAGPSAVAFAQMLVAVGIGAVTIVLQSRLFGLRADPGRPEVLAATAAVAVMAVVVVSVRGLFAGPAGAIELTLCACAGALSYVASLWLIRRLFARSLFTSWI